MIQSAIYEGAVDHHRLRPREHRFRYDVGHVYLDLDELPTLFRKRWLWSATRPALARFRREDHLGAAGEPLSESIRNLVERETGSRPQGPIRLLTNLSYFGYCFNPVSFYYCFDADGKTVKTIVAEVNNTPWGERDTYVLPESMDIGKRGVKRFRPEKKMHVSPFMPMNINYDWRFNQPEQRLTVHMQNFIDTDKLFDATLDLEQHPVTSMNMARVLVQYPVVTMKVVIGIYYQALKLVLKRIPIYDHPDKTEKQPSTR